MPQALHGKRSSMPKVVRVNADDNKAILYKNLGNGRRVPFLYGMTVTLASGTQEVTVSSGVKFNDVKVADGIITATPLAGDNVGRYYINKNTTTNVVKLKSTTTAPADVDFDIHIFVGDDASFNSSSSNQIWKSQSGRP